MVEGCSADEMRLTNTTSQKRQRTLTESEEKKKRTGTLLDLDATDCPVCFDSLTIPIFQCENGHIACSTCCGKLRAKCATCSKTIRSRNRALERILELLTVPCPNDGCSETLPYAEKSTHVKHCAYTQRTCPFSSCDFICSFKDLYEHCVAAKHCEEEDSDMFERGTRVFIHPVSGKRIILKEQTTEGEGEGEIVVVERFDMPLGRIVYASCIGPGTDEYSCKFDICLSSGKRLSSESKLERVREVSDELPGGSVMFVPSSTSPDYKFFVTIKRGGLLGS
ncbi:Seven-in-absentia protein [Hirschfeldia incana]|nr:Seven-in-absentia protein [Hirschfeldia incana]